MLNSYRVMSTKTRLISTASAILIVAVLVIVGAVTKAQTSQTNTHTIKIPTCLSNVSNTFE